MPHLHHLCITSGGAGGAPPGWMDRPADPNPHRPAALLTALKMNLSPYYDEIKNRALEILQDPEGYTFDGLSQREILAWRRKHELTVSANHMADSINATF